VTASIIEVAGESLELLPDRAVFWRRASMLLVADAHWGKAAAFRAAGVPAPHGTTHHGLERLTALCQSAAVRRIVFLGDFLHAATGRAPQTMQALSEWRSAHETLDVVIVRGNHDRGAGDPPGFSCVDGPLLEPPFVLQHHPRDHRDGYVLAGHLHPAVQLVGPGRQHERLPCFWFQERQAVLPAFGPFTGLATVTPCPTDRVYVIAGDTVHPVSPGAARDTNASNRTVGENERF
jgi:DNA ligase-associated metallophosphoesterase